MCKISVIMPVYNVEGYLRETIESLENQTMKDFEVIFIDDGSTDSSKEILEACSKKHENFRLVCQENSGPSRARNKGIKLAKGEYIAFMDSDDIIPKDSLEVRYKLATEHDAEVVVCGTYMYDGKKKWPIQSHFLEGEKNLRNSYELLWTLGPCNKLFKTSLIRDSEFPEDIKYAEDQVFVIDAYLRANKVYTSKYLAYFYRVRPEEDKTSLTSLVQNNSSYVIEQVTKVWVTLNKIIEKNCTNFYTAEALKQEYLGRLVSVDIWPPFMAAMVTRDEKIQLKVLESMLELIDNIDDYVFNNLRKLRWIVIQGVINKFLFLTPKARKKSVELIVKAYEKFDSNSKNILKVENEFLNPYVKKVVKHKSYKYIIFYLVRRKISRIPGKLGRIWKKVYNKIKNRTGQIIFNIAKILPIKNNKVVLASNKTSELSGNLKFICDELEKRGKYDIRIFMNRPDRGILESLSLYTNMARAKYIVLDDYYRQQYGLKFKNKVEVVQVWHACGAFKKFAFSAVGKGDGNPLWFEKRAHASYTKVITSSKDVIPQFAEAFNVPKENVLPLGVPRTDILLDEDYRVFRKRNFESQYPKLKGKKIITYAPTFRGNARERQSFKVELNATQILRGVGEDYVIVFKLHPSVKNGFNINTIPKDLKDRVINMDSSADINDVIMISDIVISDYSSVVFEAALLNKKMIMYAYDKEEYLGERDFYFDYDEFVPGPIARKNEDIISIINNDDFDMEKVKEFKEKFCDSCDGKSSERFVNSIFNEK
ncbi:MAG: bifunctional glycosyltransferase/CDP-glycerol:glycerophosphate glycerophosphotransferase [Clostridium sp.]|uniref:bifunctional glycosyltransferase/CDP-glycerol:glycerophosphate glycerophosphotransferase n=1 Tax=Clostridium sp. TaxID=1506 RepID=UPI003F3F9826